MLDSQAGSILYEDIGTAFDRAFLIAHELGHFVLEGDTQNVLTEEVEPDRSAEDAPVGVERVLDYGARERREVRMDLFARELLLPRSVARRHHIDSDFSSVDIATRLGAPLQVVQQQLLDALLLPTESPVIAEPTAAVPIPTPDPTQIAAANHRDTAFLLQAGPGTGKTRTLVQRIESLLAEGVDPMSILVLTFSNKAANELSGRLAARNLQAAAAMWIGTFHAFGLDIVRRFHDKLGLPANPRLIDRSEGIELLEDELPRLSLRHYRNLWDPALDLSDMLSAISRAKDEVVDAAGLVRVSTMPTYELLLQDVGQIIEQLRESKVAALEWRLAKNWPPELAKASKAALNRAAMLFDGVNPTSNPWSILSTWVIDRLGLAKSLYLAGDARSRMKGLALWQFLNFCRQQPSGAGAPRVRLLDRIRRLVLLSEDRGLRHLPGAADSIDAVRLMTIHASKGLEFHTVHIPGMVTSGLPRNNMAPRCVPPDGLIHGSDGMTGLEAVKAGHDEEEECLFFVELSRARDRLFLYASSVQSDGRARNPSKFMPSIMRHLIQPPTPPQRPAGLRPMSALQIA